MEKKITISFNISDAESKTPPVAHQEELETKAMEHIFEMSSEGYTSGELCEHVGDIEYTGFWQLTTETL